MKMLNLGTPGRKDKNSGTESIKQPKIIKRNKGYNGGR